MNQVTVIEHPTFNSIFYQRAFFHIYIKMITINEEKLKDEEVFPYSYK